MPAKCEVRSVIRFLHAKGECPADIHRQLVSVYGNIMNRQNVTKLCRAFSEGRAMFMKNTELGTTNCVHAGFQRGRTQKEKDELRTRLPHTQVLDHPPYSPDLAPSDFHLFLYLKRHLAGQNLHDDDEIKNEVEIRFRQQAVDFYDCEIQKLAPRVNKCLDNGGNFVEK
ncbi:hypothetical protein AVEN_76942-1 [Araneus ventricosus]|uniref:Histone-lysine N-methyltransferase SETMAR n=1 Tax=Araneus ventricosus TaxID=182803 RepID=A0A4Y2FIZ5_ARAVE|nr:hypothetical protein AVEN_76942-1 [Araneus ventricosus]